MHIAMVCIMREGEGKRERDKQRKTEAEKEKSQELYPKFIKINLLSSDYCIVDWQLSTYRINAKYALMNYLHTYIHAYTTL